MAYERLRPLLAYVWRRRSSRRLSILSRGPKFEDREPSRDRSKSSYRIYEARGNDACKNIDEIMELVMYKFYRWGRPFQDMAYNGASRNADNMVAKITHLMTADFKLCLQNFVERS
jgi:hypothetical protein